MSETVPSATPSSFWTLRRVAAALAHGAPDETVRAYPCDDRPIRAICTDTRAIQPGDCFVALVGERFDAHDFLAQAAAAGAAALVVSRPLPLGTLDVPVYVVDDTLRALGDLARYWRRAWGKPIVAIAGSNGKTTTKELTRAALASVYDVHATAGNFNNRIGVPLTLLAIPPHADIAVVEAGTSEPGEIAALRSIIEPDIAVMTWIAEEHLERLGDLEGVLREESDIFTGVPVAIVPSAQPHVVAAARAGAQRVVSAGLEQADVMPQRWSLCPDGSGQLVIDGVTVTVPLRGAHNVRNAMLALAVARECYLTDEQVARGIAAVQPPPMRSAWQSIGQATVINDAYNANPASMRAALELLASANGSQRVALLGTMRELGAEADRYHDDIARAAVASNADLVAGVGEMADALRRVAPAAGDRVITAPDVEQLWPLLAPRLARDATILLKASRGVRLERMLPHITTWATI
jgi:UDP-N-acetylmuramoyl-tripeptide--D-alanyl-D-alanine ligase